MKRSGRVFVIVVVLLALAAAGAWAKGKSTGGLRLGLEFGNPHAVLIIRPAPFDFRVGYNFTDNGNLFFALDYRIVDRYRIVDFLYLFLGVGLYTDIFFNPADFDFGARIPVGLQVFLIDNVLELFLEVAPTVAFLPALLAFPEWQGFIGFTIKVH
jgi:hypothetical protein